MTSKSKSLLFLLTLSYGLGGCNSDKNKDYITDTVSNGNTSVMVKEAEKTITASPTESYVVIPDTALLGKSFEAKAKVNNVSLLPLLTPDGKSTGSELTVKLSITNKSTLDKKKFFNVSPSEARLEMDNGQAIPISKSSGKTDPEPESSSNAEWKFNIPPGVKPTKLHLFMEGTRVTLDLKQN